MNKLKTLQYFCESLLAPSWEIFRVLEDPNHKEYDNLMDDLQSIDKLELENYLQKHHIDFFIEKHENKDLAKRSYFLMNALHYQIGTERLNALCKFDTRPRPYNSENLNGLDIDKYNLIGIENFAFSIFGLTYNGFGYSLCPSICQDNSSYWTSCAISELSNKKNIKFKIRLNPFIEIPIADYHPMIYLMTIHGEKLDLDRIITLKRDEFGQFLNEKDYHDYSFTEYVWHPNKDEIHFSCEELPTTNSCEYRGSRYLHAIFKRSSGKVIHCDGSIRKYIPDELSTRSMYHLKNPVVRKIGKRIKLFQTDCEIDQFDFILLTLSFFVWNEDIDLYFSLKSEHLPQGSK